MEEKNSNLLTILIIVLVVILIIFLFRERSQENFNEAKKWFVEIPGMGWQPNKKIQDNILCPPGTNNSTSNQSTWTTCCRSHEPTSRKYKSLNPDYEKYIVDSCTDYS